MNDKELWCENCQTRLDLASHDRQVAAAARTEALEELTALLVEALDGWESYVDFTISTRGLRGDPPDPDLRRIAAIRALVSPVLPEACRWEFEDGEDRLLPHEPGDNNTCVNCFAVLPEKPQTCDFDDRRTRPSGHTGYHAVDAPDAVLPEKE